MKSLSLSLTYDQAPIKGFPLPANYTRQRIAVRWPKNGHPWANSVLVAVTWVGGLAVGCEPQTTLPLVWPKNGLLPMRTWHYWAPQAQMDTIPTSLPSLSRRRWPDQGRPWNIWLESGTYPRVSLRGLIWYIYCLCLVSFVKSCIFWDKLWKLSV